MAYGDSPAVQAFDPGFLERAAVMNDSHNYKGVLDQLNHISTEGIPLAAAEAEEADYLQARALYELSDPRAVRELRRFVNLYPASPRATECLLLTGDYFFFAGDYSSALQEYKRIDLATLNSAERNLYTCRKAICLLKRGYYDESRPLVGSLSGKSGYDLAAKYYDAYLDYVAGRDAEALKKFKEVAEIQSKSGRKSGNNSGNLSGETLYPEYYIAQLLFRLGDYDDCIKTARNILRRYPGKEARNAGREMNSLPGGEMDEMTASTHRVLGMSLYKTGELTAARGSLEACVASAVANAGDDALYALGACEYSAGDLSQAAGRFSKLLDSRDAIAQGSYLYLGQIEASRGNATAAAIDFEKAYRMNFDNKVAETALYNYAAAISRGGNIPFARSADMLERFLENYPGSEYAADVERYLGRMYCQRGEYDSAIAAMDKIRRPSAEDKELLGVILYEAGAAALSEKNPKRAASLLRRCVNQGGVNPDVLCQANIWLGDALYCLGEYRNAEKAYAAAAKSGKAGENTPLLDYDLGYALMMQNKFGEASRYFTKAEKSPTLTSGMRYDAAMRIADCKYYTGDYAGAAADFESMMKSGKGADYASYRHAQILGIRGDVAGKIAALESFESRFPKSDLIPDALAELADTYASEGKQEKAASVLSRRLTNYDVNASAEDYFNLAEYNFAAGNMACALEAYRKAEQTGDTEYLADARAGVMKSTGDEDQRLDYARKLLATPGASADILEEAEMIVAISDLDSPQSGSQSVRNAVAALERLSENPFTEAGARSAVELGEYYLKSGDSRRAMELMEKFTSSGSGRQYWVARGFIVLADACKAQGEDYLSSEYLKSLRDNYPGSEPDIMRMIQERLK